MINDHIQEVLVIMGVPKEVFYMADPIAILMAYIFSTRIFIMILSIIIWLGVFTFKSSSGIRVKDQSQISGEQGVDSDYDIKDPFKNVKNNKNTSFQSNRGNVHQYNADNPFETEQPKKQSLLGLVFRGIIFPVIVIYIALSVSVSMFTNA
ncbi:MAG: hypothetical protein ACRBB3_10555 [Alphaproteobacteria bacterium]